MIAKVVIVELKQLLEKIRRGADSEAREAAALASDLLFRLHKRKAQASAINAMSKCKPAAKRAKKAEVESSG